MRRGGGGGGGDGADGGAERDDLGRHMADGARGDGGRAGGHCVDRRGDYGGGGEGYCRAGTSS